MLVAAAILAFAIGVAHSWLGERYIITRLLRRKDLPKLLGSDLFTRRTLRFAWHLTTIAWWGFAAQMLVLSFPITLPASRSILMCISLVFAASGAVSGVVSRGKHLSWIVFLAISVLCRLASL
jgi:hypothetical protein